MGGFVVSFFVGIICIVLGISNMKGNISSLHSYHRKNITEEDRLPFGRLVGLGTIIIGVGIMIFSLVSAISMLLGQEVYIIVGSVIMIIALIVGLVISFYAMIKYNHGIF